MLAVDGEDAIPGPQAGLPAGVLLGRVTADDAIGGVEEPREGAADLDAHRVEGEAPYQQAEGQYDRHDPAWVAGQKAPIYSHAPSPSPEDVAGPAKARL